MTIHQKYLCIIFHNLLANNGDPLMILGHPPTEVGALLIIFSKLGQGMIDFTNFVL